MKIITLEQLLRRRKTAAPREMPTRQSRALLHWKILVAIFFLASVWVVCSSIWIYREIGLNPDTANGPQLSGADNFKSDMASIVQQYDSKNAAFVQIQAKNQASAGPSL